MAPKRSAAELALAMQAVRDEEAACRKEAKRLQTQARRAARREQDPFSAYQKDVAMTLFLLAEWRAGAAVEYLEGLKPGHPGLETLVEEWVLATPQERINLMGEEETAPKASVFRYASGFYLKYQLARWVEHRNTEDGVAPPTSDVLRQHDIIAVEHGVGTASRRRIDIPRNRTWATRWRRQHRVVLGTPRVEEHQSVEEMRSKALVSWQLHNYHTAQTDKRVLRLNLDETRILFYVKSGAESSGHPRWGAQGEAATDGVQERTARGNDMYRPHLRRPYCASRPAPGVPYQRPSDLSKGDGLRGWEPSTIHLPLAWEDIVEYGGHNGQGDRAHW